MPSGELVALLITAFGGLGIVVVVVIIVLLNPDKAHRWAEILWALISKVWRGGNSRAVQHGVQSRLMTFSREMAGETGHGEAVQVKVEWAPKGEQPSQFMGDGRLVVRLHAYEHQDRNDLTASLLFISHTLVRRAKIYLPKRRARSVDLYAVDRLLTRTAPAAADLLHEEIMGPECDADHELGDMLVDYQKVDRINGFFPIFIRELNYLAGKVVVKPRGDQLVRDVNELHRFLVRYSDRRIGEEMPMEVQGRFLRCAVMIVAKSAKRDIGDRAPYVKYISRLATAGHETIYLIGNVRRENADFMRAIARDFRNRSGWSEIEQRTFGATLHDADGSDIKVRNLLIVLRTNAPRDYVGVADEVPEPSDMPTFASVEVEGDTAA